MCFIDVTVAFYRKSRAQNLAGPWKLLHKHISVRRLTVDVYSTYRAPSAPTRRGGPLAMSAPLLPPPRLGALANPTRPLPSPNDGYGMHAALHAQQQQQHGHYTGLIDVDSGGGGGSHDSSFGSHSDLANMLCVAPRVDVRVRLFAQPLMTNFRAVPPRKLLAALSGPGAPLAPSGAAVSIDVSLPEPIQINVGKAQIALLQRMGASLSHLFEAPPPPTTTPLAHPSVHLSAHNMPPHGLHAAHASSSSIWSNQGDSNSLAMPLGSADPFAGASAALPSSASGPRRGVVSWMWRTFVTNDDDDGANVSLQEAAHAAQARAVQRRRAIWALAIADFNHHPFSAHTQETVFRFQISAMVFVVIYQRNKCIYSALNRL